MKTEDFGVQDPKILSGKPQELKLDLKVKRSIWGMKIGPEHPALRLLLLVAIALLFVAFVERPFLEWVGRWWFKW